MIFNKFKLYSVMLNPDHENPYETAVFIPEGFNFFAFIFHVFWMLYKRIWVSAILFMIIFAIIYIMADVMGVSPISVVVLKLGVRFMAGLEGNNMLRISLIKKGYVVADVVAAGSLLEAQQRYFDHRLTRGQVLGSAPVSI